MTSTPEQPDASARRKSHEPPDVIARRGWRYHHLGIYAFRRAALQRFVTLAPSTLERSEKLEQLRALADGMRIDAALVDTIPLGVDTPADLERARALIGVRH